MNSKTLLTTFALSVFPFYPLQAEAPVIRVSAAVSLADVFFSADMAKMDCLEKKGLIDVATRGAQLSNALVEMVSPEI